MNEDLVKLAKLHGTPLFIIDHDKIRENYRAFKRAMPRVQAYYAVKANSNQEIIKTLFDEGASFDVASYNEFMQVYEYIKDMRKGDKDFYVWDKIIFSNTIKDIQTLAKINRYKPLMTYDNKDELAKVREYCGSGGLVLRLKVPDIGSQVEMGSKFGCEPSDAASLIKEAFDIGLKVEGLSFHVGSQCTNFDNYASALQIVGDIFSDSRKKGYNLNLIDIGGGFPVPYDANVPRVEKLGALISSECDRLFPKDVEILAEPGRFMVATTSVLVSEIIGKARREGKIFYHINDGVYHTFSGVVYDHWIPNFHAFRDGPEEVCAVVGPTCDSFDKITMAVTLPSDLNVHRKHRRLQCRVVYEIQRLRRGEDTPHQQLAGTSKNLCVLGISVRANDAVPCGRLTGCVLVVPLPTASDPDAARVRRTLPI
jgi:ornithine decarboxylase